jgi:diacylglycerol kinase (ATP)
MLAASGMDITMTPTTGPGEATEYARRAVASGADLVLAAGGDGTLNEVVNGMVHSRVPLGILPGGTANVLANELGLAGPIDTVAASVAQLAPERISAGLLRAQGTAPRHFLLMAGAGLDAHIVSTIDSELKKKLGKLAYWIGGLGQLGRRFPQFEVSAAGRSLKCSFALASRVRSYGGGLEIARTACLLDDYFELVTFEGEQSSTYLKYFSGVLTGQHAKMKGVSILQACRVEFSSPPDIEAYVQIDGEFAGHLPAEVEIVPDALTLLAPPGLRDKYSARRGVDPMSE